MNNTTIALFVILCAAQIFNIIRMEISAHKIRELEKYVVSEVAGVYIGMIMMTAEIKANKDNIAKIVDEMYKDDDESEDANVKR